jgi:hypothetical protein
MLATELSEYADGGLLDAALGDLAAAVGGEQMFGLLVGGALLLSFYLASNGGLTTPAALTALSGGLLISALPPAYRAIAQTVIFLGLAVGVMALFDKFVDREP